MADADNAKRMGFAPAVMMACAIGIVPVAGPLAGGVLAARRAGFGAAAVAAAIWAAALMLASRGTVQVGQEVVALDLLRWLVAPVAALMLGGGAFGGAGLRSLAGWACVVVAIGAVVVRVQDVRQVLSVLLPARAAAYDATRNRTCPDNLKQLYIALQMYADSWDGLLPPADGWLAAIRDNVPKDAWLRCPDAGGAPGERYGYAMNTALGGKRLDRVADRAGTPLLYDSSDLRAGAHDAVATLPKPGRHMLRNNVLYADGQVRSAPPR